MRGAFLTIKYAERLLAPGSSVLFNASVAVHVGSPLCSVYAATKGAVAAFAKSVAAELLPRSVRVNTLSPGPTATPIQSKAPMSPEAMTLVAPYVMNRMRLGRLGNVEESPAWPPSCCLPSPHSSSANTSPWTAG